MSKTALVLSSGGMFGAYQAGVWRVLSGVFRPDILVGASVGALNAWAIAGGCGPDELIQAWLDPERASLVRWARWPAPWRGLFDSRHMEERIRRLWADYRPRQEIGIVAVELPGLRRRLFRGTGIEWQHLAASCAVLGGFPQRRIDGKLYSDGGLLGALPVWAAAEMGAKRVVAVNVLEIPPSVAVRNAVRMFQALAGRPPVLPPDLERVTISPSQALGSLGDALFWSRANAERWIERGMRDAAKQNIFFPGCFARK